MVSKFPNPEMMAPEDRERLKEKMADVVEEDDQPESNGRFASLKDLEPESEGFRYTKKPIFGIAKAVRFRSLTARHFEKIAQEEDRNILLHSICDEQGRLMIEDPETLDALIDRYDARTYAELLSAANMHCLGRGGLDEMIEESAGN